MDERSNLTDTLWFCVMSWRSLYASAMRSCGLGVMMGPVTSGFSSSTNHTSTSPVLWRLLSWWAGDRGWRADHEQLMKKLSQSILKPIHATPSDIHGLASIKTNPLYRPTTHTNPPPAIQTLTNMSVTLSGDTPAIPATARRMEFLAASKL